MKTLYVVLLILFVGGCKSDVGVTPTPTDTWKLSVWSRVTKYPTYLSAEVMPDSTAWLDSIRIEINGTKFVMGVDRNSGGILVSYFQPPIGFIQGLPIVGNGVPHTAWTKAKGA